METEIFTTESIVTFGKYLKVIVWDDGEFTFAITDEDGEGDDIIIAGEAAKQLAERILHGTKSIH